MKIEWVKRRKWGGGDEEERRRWVGLSTGHFSLLYMYKRTECTLNLCLLDRNLIKRVGVDGVTNLFRMAASTLDSVLRSKL